MEKSAPNLSAGGKTRLGVLGGGQLARMLIEGARPLGSEIAIFAESADLPAGRLGSPVTVGTIPPADAPIEAFAPLIAFLSKLDRVAFENEFIDTRALRRAAQGVSVRFFPDLPAIEELSDKLRQKQLLQRLGIPSAPFQVVQPETLDPVLASFGGEAVLKWSRMGYDGKGVKIARSDSPEGMREAREFCALGFARGAEIYAERRIDFRRELAIAAVRSVNGDFAAYPLVISEQEQGICDRVRGPARRLGVPEALEAEARAHSRNIAESLDIVGAFALELFETRDGKLLVNEIAPRVHNSAHYTQDASPVSQFENHWRAILGQPLGDTESAGTFAMLNLLGPPSISRPDAPELRPRPATSRVKLHWYEKHDLRPLRKLGHLNGVAADSTPDLNTLCRELEATRTTWIQNVVSHSCPPPSQETSS